MGSVFEALARPLDYPAPEFAADLAAALAFAGERAGEPFQRVLAPRTATEPEQSVELSSHPYGWFVEGIVRRYRPDLAKGMARALTTLSIANFISANADELKKAGLLNDSADRLGGADVSLAVIAEILRFAPVQIDREPERVLRAVLAAFGHSS